MFYNILKLHDNRYNNCALYHIRDLPQMKQVVRFFEHLRIIYDRIEKMQEHTDEIYKNLLQNMIESVANQKVHNIKKSLFSSEWLCTRPKKSSAKFVDCICNLD